MNESPYKPKNTSELLTQLKEADLQVSGGDKESSLIPPSVKKQDILKMPIEEIKEKYAIRYEMYLRLVRDRKQTKGTDEVKLSESDIADMRKWLMGLNSLDRYIDAHKTGELEMLRERQVPIFEDLRNFIEQGGTSGYVKLPTGVGKTVLFTELVESLNLKTIIVVPTAPLIEQTEDKFVEFAPDMEVGKIYADAKEHGRQVTIITYDSLISQIKSGMIKPADYDFLVLDEVHTSLSKQRSNAVRQFDNALKLGFTATPEYSYEKKVGNLLEQKIHSLTIREAVEDNLLAPFTAMVARTQVDLSQVPMSEDNGEWEQDMLEKAVNVTARNQSAVDLYKKTFNDEAAVVYCVNVQHADSVARLFNSEGITAIVISGKTPIAEQRRIKKEFKEGKIKVICNADILIPGFDEPRASVCFNLRPTRSRVIAEQRGGRVLRIDENNPDKHAYIVDFIDQGLDQSRLPVLFADVAEGVEFMPKFKGNGSGGGGGGGRHFAVFDIPGLEVITNVEEIMSIVSKHHEGLRRKEKISYEDFTQEVRAAGIKDSKQYSREYRNHPGWPSNPDNFAPFRGKWKDWDTLLDKNFLSLEKLKEAVRAAGIKDSITYQEEQKKHPRWHSKPYVYYGSEWRGWGDLWLGALDYDTFINELLDAKIKTKKKYQREYKKHANWPPDPTKTYSGKFVQWGLPEEKRTDYIQVKERPSFDLLKREVQLHKFKSRIYYTIAARHNASWPLTPENVFKAEWKGWDDFLGNK